MELQKLRANPLEHSAMYAAEIVSIRQESTHVKYCIELTFSEQKWQVHRRYRDLFQLHQLLRSPAFHELPPLPTRRAFGLGKWLFQQDEDFIAERQKEFQRYLDALLLMDPQLSHGALRLFLGLPVLPASITLEAALHDVHLPEVSWKTPSKVDLRLIRINRKTGARLADIPLSVVELAEVAQSISSSVGLVGTSHFRVASRTVARTIQKTLPGLLSSSRIYVLSAWKDRSEVLSLFNPSDGTFEKVPMGPVDPYYAVASRGGNLYILMSGEDPSSAGIQWHASFHCWQASVRKWRQLPPRPGDELTRFSLTATGSSIYALGGIGRKGCRASAHRFNLNQHSGRWETLPSLLAPRCDATAVARGSVVFLLGGSDESGEVCNDVESFEVWKNAWRRGPQLLGPRHGGTAASTSDSVVLFGGSAVARGHLLADAVSPPEPECLSHRWGFWAPLPSPASLSRHGCAVAALPGKVFVFGGYEAEMAHIDRWDTENLTWDTLELPLELQGVCFAAVAVS